MASTNPIDQINFSDSMPILVDANPPKQHGGFLGALGKVAGIAGNIFMPGAGGILGNMLTGAGGLGSDPMQYLRLQQRINAESRAFEATSAVLKSKHDAAMDSLRNISH